MWVQVLGGKGLKTVQTSSAVWVHLVCKISKITGCKMGSKIYF